MNESGLVVDMPAQGEGVVVDAVIATVERLRECLQQVLRDCNEMEDAEGWYSLKDETRQEIEKILDSTASGPSGSKPTPPPRTR